MTEHDAPNGAFILVKDNRQGPPKKKLPDRIARHHKPADLTIDPDTFQNYGEGMDIQTLAGIDAFDGNRHLPKRTIREKRGF